MLKAPTVLAVPMTAFSLELIAVDAVEVCVGLGEFVEVGCWDDDGCMSSSDWDLTGRVDVLFEIEKVLVEGSLVTVGIE